MQLCSDSWELSSSRAQLSGLHTLQCLGFCQAAYLLAVPNSWHESSLLEASCLRLGQPLQEALPLASPGGSASSAASSERPPQEPLAVHDATS